MIGKYYKYSGTKNRRKYKLVEIDRWMYRFECGHAVTDCVFLDMIDCETGVGNWEPQQLDLFGEPFKIVKDSYE
jgi:hypothetical protein